MDHTTPTSPQHAPHPQGEAQQLLIAGGGVIPPTLPIKIPNPNIILLNKKDKKHSQNNKTKVTTTPTSIPKQPYKSFSSLSECKTSVQVGGGDNHTHPPNPPHKHKKEKKVKVINSSGGSGSAGPTKPPKVKKEKGGGAPPTKKLRKPTAHEDIVDGFAFLAFKNYEELSRAIKLGEDKSGGSNKLCVQVLKGSQHNQSSCTRNKEGSTNAGTNTSPTTTPPNNNQNNLKPLSKTGQKRKLKKLMDQENGDVIGGEGGGGGGQRSSTGGQEEGAIPISCTSSPFSRAIVVVPSPPSSPKAKPPATKKSRLTKEFKNHFCEEGGGGESTRQPNNKAIKRSKISEGSSHLPLTNQKDLGVKRVGGVGESVQVGGGGESPPPVILPPVLPSSTGLVERIGASVSCVGGSGSCSPPAPPTHSSPSLPIGGSDPALSSSSYIPIIPYNNNNHNIRPEIGGGPSPLPPPPPGERLETPPTPSSIREEYGGGSSSTSTTTTTTNGVTVAPPPLNGHQEKRKCKSTSLFTPYATNTITRVSLGSSERSRVESPPSPPPPLPPSSTDPSFPPHPHQYYSQPGEQESLVANRGGANKSSASLVFGSIARLLDTPTSSSAGSGCSGNGRSPSLPTNHGSGPSPSSGGGPPPPNESPIPHNMGSGTTPTPPVVSSTTVGSSTLPPHSSGGGGGGGGSGGGQIPSSSLSRSHSPRGHSPCRERDSYSSSVSSLSRTSVTPVSCSSSGAVGGGGSVQHHLPPNLSPQLSYSKAASWLSSVPVPRPSPPPGPPPGPPPHSLASAIGVASSMFAPMPPGGPPPPHHYVSRATPAESIHSALLHGSSSSEFVRRDFESRFMGVGGGGGGGGMMRANEIHSLLPPSGGQPPSLYPPSSSAMFKEMSKRDSPFYRSGYPGGGGGGMLPPTPTPFAPPSQLPSFTPKKSGRWNAMHVRIAWEIYQHQQKSGCGEVKGCLQGPSTSLKSNGGIGGSGGGGGGTQGPPPQSDLFRPPTHSFSRAVEMSGYASPLNIMSSQVPAAQQRAPPTFDPTPHHPMYLAAQSHLGGGMGRYPGFGGLGSPFVGGLGSLGSSLLARDLSSLQPPPPQIPSVHEQWARLSRGGWGGGGVPPPQPPPSQHELPSSVSPLRERSPIRRENGDLERSGGGGEPSPRFELEKSNYGRTNCVDVPKGASNRGIYGGGMLSGSGGGGGGGGGGLQGPSLNWGQPFARFSPADSFRLSVLEMGERERELSRLPPSSSSGGGGGRVGGVGMSPYGALPPPPRHPSQELDGGGGVKREESNEERFATLAPL